MMMTASPRSHWSNLSMTVSKYDAVDRSVSYIMSAATASTWMHWFNSAVAPPVDSAKASEGT
jgi:hypothetical protein